jgi:hypothetical protein
MGVDLGHVIASMDIAQSFDIINDTYISWAGDLGSEVLHIFRIVPLRCVVKNLKVLCSAA